MLQNYKFVFIIFISLIIVMVLINMLRLITFDSTLFARECLTTITMKDKMSQIIEIKTDLWNDCSSFNHNLIVIHIIDLIYLIHAMHQLIYELKISTPLIVDRCCTIRIVLIQCIDNVIGHLYVRYEQSQSACFLDVKHGRAKQRRCSIYGA